VGANVPIPLVFAISIQENTTPTIGVFSITGGQPRARETEVILAAVRHAAQTLDTVTADALLPDYRRNLVPRLM
jgi:hypothetical protein